MEHGRNRVFVNPNFNKRIINNVPVTTQKQSTVMHVNPNFCQHSQNLQPMTKTKIYINPSFVRPNGVNNNFSYVNNTAATQPYVKPSPLMDSSNTLTAPVVALTRHEVQTSLLTNTAPIQPFQTNSRYSLVRQKKPEQTVSNILKPVTYTVKISKYKSIKITDIKRNLDSVPSIEKEVPFQASNSNKTLIRSSNNHKSPKISTNQVNRYRLVRLTVSKPQFKRQTSNTTTRHNRTRVKAVGVYKKNNIPCPQYRKYGKCLRKSYGKCEFLHDEKHVSICRRFLNGVCHNDKCLLSHELSDKKMPTCYFYLKGMCTKEGCPYLHVKLNERAKICLDFMRGYCEKGDKCLNRHIAKSSSSADLKARRSLKKLSQQKLMKYKLVKNKIKNNASSTQKRKSKIQLNQPALLDSNESGSRYYKESVQESNTSESLEIKPLRCKLGTLPSFIQL